MKDYTILFLDDTQLTVKADQLDMLSDGKAILYVEGVIKAVLTSYKYVVMGTVVFDKDENGESK